MTAPDLAPHADELRALSVQLAAIQKGMRELKAAESDAKARVRRLIGAAVGAIAPAGELLFAVSFGKRFDPALAAEVLPPETVAAISETVVSAEKAKATLPPAVYELCQRESDEATIKPKLAAS